MSAIDIDALLKDVGADDPCGDDLEYDADFGALERLSQVKPEQQFGGTIIPAEEPDWREVRKAAVALFDRTKDLRVCVHLAKALIRTDGYIGFADAVSIIRTLIDDRWEGVYPRLDPDDDNDPTMRVNTLISLCDPDSVVRPLRDAPLVQSPTLGRYGLRDLAVAAGDLPAPAGGDHAPPDAATIHAAFMDVAVEELQATAAAVDRTIDDIGRIESTVTSRVGAANAPNLETLIHVLKEAKSTLAERLSRRGVKSADAGADAGEAADGAAPAEARTAAAPRTISGDISSREDVIRMLGKISEYYNRYEPSSPVPLLINRAKRLVTMSFLEILRDLAPDGVGQAELIGGAKESSEPEQQQTSSSSW